MVTATLRKPASVASAPEGKNTVGENQAAEKAEQLETAEASLYDESTVKQPGQVQDAGEVCATEVVDSVPAGAVACRPAFSAPSRYSTASDGAFEGEFSGDDVKYPALKIVQGSGPLSQSFNIGTTLYGDDVLFPPSAPDKPGPLLRFIPIHLRKQFRENLSQDEQASGAMSRFADTLAEVESLGGSTRWIEGQKPSWSPTATAMLLLEEPEGNECPGFSLEFNGKCYAPAIYYASGGSYNAFAKTIFNLGLTTLLIPATDADGKPILGPGGRPAKKTCLYKSFWTWQTCRVKAGQYTVYRPTARLLSKDNTSAEIREFCQGLVGNLGATQAAVAAE